MNTFNKVLTMLRLQQENNIVTQGAEWYAKGNSWANVIIAETGEYLDSVGYKWWKQQDIDIENAKTELVDIWHFLLSDLIEPELLFRPTAQFSFEDRVKPLGQHIAFVVDGVEEKPLKPNTEYDKNVTPFINAMLNRNPDTVKQFLRLCQRIGMGFDELYTRYVVKNALNRFRQNNGYNDGTYRKIIDGLEDNTQVLRLAAELPEVTVDSVYKAYEAFYKSNVRNAKN